MSYRHNKKRNTAFVYEALVNELTKARAVGDNERSEAAIGILKKYFGKGTNIHEEYLVYKDLCDSPCEFSREEYERLIDESKSYLKESVDRQRLKEEKDSLIAAINRKLGSAVFNNFIPHYRRLASLGQILDESTRPAARVKLRGVLYESLKPESKDEHTLRPLDSFEFKVFCETFNEEYSDFLPEQRELLTRYVSAIGDDVEYKMYLNREVGRLSGVLEGYSGEHEEKIGKVLEVLAEMKERPVSDEDAATVLRVQKLVKEISPHD